MKPRAHGGRRRDPCRVTASRALARRWPGRPEILFRLGESELACGRVDEAMIAWSQIPPISPLRARAALAQAQVTLHTGRFSAAERILREALEQPGPYANDLRHMLLVILGLEGRLEAAPRLIEERYGQERIPVAERLALLHDHIALDLEPMPLEGNLEYLGAAGPTDSDDPGLWLARSQYRHQDRPARRSRSLARCPGAPQRE